MVRLILVPTATSRTVSGVLERKSNSTIANARSTDCTVSASADARARRGGSFVSWTVLFSSFATRPSYRRGSCESRGYRAGRGAEETYEDGTKNIRGERNPLPPNVVANERPGEPNAF